MVNPLPQLSSTGGKIKDQWMDTSVSCSIKFQYSSVSFALTLPFVQWRAHSSQLFTKSPFVPSYPLCLQI